MNEAGILPFTYPNSSNDPYLNTTKLGSNHETCNSGSKSDKKVWKTHSS